MLQLSTKGQSIWWKRGLQRQIITLSTRRVPVFTLLCIIPHQAQTHTHLTFSASLLRGTSQLFLKVSLKLSLDWESTAWNALGCSTASFRNRVHGPMWERGYACGQQPRNFEEVIVSLHNESHFATFDKTSSQVINKLFFTTRPLLPSFTQSHHC